MVTIQGIAGSYQDLLVPLHGAHQAENAAVAIAALEAFFGGEKAIDAEILQEAFASVTSPGRLEVVRTAPTIIVDAAHNPDGIRVSAEAIHEAFNFTKLVVVVGVLREKDAEEILRQLEESLGGLATEYCFTQSNRPGPSRPRTWPRSRSTSASARTTSTSPGSSTTPSNGPWNAPKPTTSSPAGSS